MFDSHGREINYLRVSVTDRCNLRCRYCMPAEGIDKLGHKDILSLEEIHRLIRVSVGLGIKKIRLTGGEPLIRDNLVWLIREISAMSGIDDVAITTNGILFAGMAADLKNAGLNRVNISMDTLDSEKFKFITRGGSLEAVQKAVHTALELGIEPVKINTVIIKGFNDNEILKFAALAYRYPIHIRFIEFMPVGDLLFWNKDRMITSDQVRRAIEQEYELFTGKRIEGNGPAKYYHISGGQGTVGFISPMSNHFCGSCNRIRMMADGGLRGCLYEKGEINLKKALADGASDDELRQLFVQAIDKKAPRHQMDSGWGAQNQRKMYQIGG